MSKEALRRAMDELGMTDNMLRAGTAAICGGENHFTSKWETSWKNTDNARIRSFFSRLRNMSDAELTSLKRDDVAFFDAVYGGRFGNVNPGDGYRYRGGGMIQLTFHDNYKQIGDDIGYDLAGNPQMIVDNEDISAKAAVAYMLRHFKGGDFTAMKKAVGVSMGEPDAEKNRLFDLFMQTREWDAGPKAVVDDEPVAQVIVDFIAAYQKAARFLSTQKEKPYTGPLNDKDPGKGFHAAYVAYMSRKGIKV